MFCVVMVFGLSNGSSNLISGRVSKQRWRSDFTPNIRNMSEFLSERLVSAVDAQTAVLVGQQLTPFRIQHADTWKLSVALCFLAVCNKLFWGFLPGAKFS